MGLALDNNVPQSPKKERKKCTQYKYANERAIASQEKLITVKIIVQWIDPLKWTRIYVSIHLAL